MQEGADEAGGDLKKAEELLRIKSGAKASKAAGRVAAEGVIGAYLVAGRQARRAGRGQLRDRLRRQERGLPRLRAERWPKLVADQQPGRRRGAVGAVDRRRERRGEAPGAGAEDRREHRRCAVSSRYETQGTLAQYVHGSRIGVLVDLRRRRRELGKDLAMHIAFEQAGVRVEGRSAGRAHRPRARHLQRAGGRVRQAGQDRREDGRGPPQQVPRGDHAARPAVRQGRQADRREAARGARRPRCSASRLFVVGEGIEKKTTDFAAEVMAQAGLSKAGA